METAKYAWIAGLLILLSGSRAQAQSEPLEQELQIRVGAGVKTEVIEDVDVYLKPEMRTDGLSPNRYLMELAVRYKPIKYFSMRGEFRSDLEDESYGLVHGYRPAASVSGHLPFLDDFKAEVRALYTHAFGPYEDIRRTLRYRGGVEYNVPKVKLDIGISAEAFHRVPEGEFNRMRYAIEGKYKFYNTKRFDQWISLGYMLDYLLTRPLNRHIPTIGYSAEF